VGAALDEVRRWWRPLVRVGLVDILDPRPTAAELSSLADQALDGDFEALASHLRSMDLYPWSRDKVEAAITCLEWNEFYFQVFPRDTRADGFLRSLAGYVIDIWPLVIALADAAARLDRPDPIVLISLLYLRQWPGSRSVRSSPPLESGGPGIPERDSVVRVCSDIAQIRHLLSMTDERDGLPFLVQLLSSDSSIAHEDAVKAVTAFTELWPELLDLLQKDIASPAVQQRIEANLALGRKLDISGTPAYVIGEQMLPGALGLAELQDAVAAARKAPGSTN